MQTTEPYDMKIFDENIAEFFHLTSAENNSSKRLAAAAALFIGKPYVWEPLGEGVSGKYYQEPLYRTDQFDCVTYVDTVLALAKSSDLNKFKQHNLQIRYANGNIDYTQRTDWFTDLEWIPNAQKLGWLKDVTELIVDKKGNSIALIAATIIDKPNWYKVKMMKALHLLKPLAQKEAKQLLMQLQTEGQAFKATPSKLTYLPLNKLFNAEGKPDPFLFDQIPSASVIAIVKPNWQIRDHFENYPQGYGTNLNVSHLGIAIRTEEGLMFYHATSLEKKVICLPLTDYLQHKTIQGIHVEQII